MVIVPHKEIYDIVLGYGIKICFIKNIELGIGLCKTNDAIFSNLIK